MEISNAHYRGHSLLAFCIGHHVLFGDFPSESRNCVNLSRIPHFDGCQKPLLVRRCFEAMAALNEGIMTQARFWVYHRSGIVRIKLNEGQTVGFSYGGPTDEGYSYTAEQYSFDGQHVVSKWRTDARDCDGRITHTGSAHCRFSRLSSGTFADEVNAVQFPDWMQGESSQRDFSAEAMGY
jgi:hypothetical protein